MPGVVATQAYYEIKSEFDWWSTNGDKLFKHIAKLQEDIKAMHGLKENERKTMLALKMFYLSTKLATQIKHTDDAGFKKAIERITQAEELLLELIED